MIRIFRHDDGSRTIEQLVPETDSWKPISESDLEKLDIVITWGNLAITK
jgi:hypothetical protein